MAKSRVVATALDFCKGRYGAYWECGLCEAKDVCKAKLQARFQKWKRSFGKEVVERDLDEQQERWEKRMRSMEE